MENQKTEKYTTYEKASMFIIFLFMAFGTFYIFKQDFGNAIIDYFIAGLNISQLTSYSQEKRIKALEEKLEKKGE